MERFFYFIIAIVGCVVCTLYIKQRVNEIEALKAKKIIDGSIKEFFFQPKKYITDYTMLYFFILCLILLFSK